MSGKGPSSSPFKTPDHSSNPKRVVGDVGQASSPRKRTRMDTTPTLQLSPRTAARYGVAYEEATKISKRATNFKDLMAVMAKMIAWGIENPDFSDEELGRQVIKSFRECNVWFFCILELIVSHQNRYTLD